MSLSDKIQTAAVSAAALSALATLVTLLLLKAQVKSSDRAARAGVYQGIVQQMLDIDRLLFEQPDLKAAFFGEPPATDAHGVAVAVDQRQLLSLAELIIDFADNVYIQATNIQLHFKEDPWPAWGRYFQELHSGSPAIRRVLDDHPGWYPPDLVRMFKTGEVEAAGPRQQTGAARRPRIPGP